LTCPALSCRGDPPCRLAAYSAHSTELNGARLKVLKARDEVLREVYDDADKRLARISSENADVYQTLLSSLILQSLLALSDGEVVVRTREADAKTVEAALKTVSEQYTDKTDGSSLDVVVDSKRFLSENWYVVRWWVSGLSLAGVRHPVSEVSAGGSRGETLGGSGGETLAAVCVPRSRGPQRGCGGAFRRRCVREAVRSIPAANACGSRG